MALRFLLCIDSPCPSKPENQQRNDGRDIFGEHDCMNTVRNRRDRLEWMGISEKMQKNYPTINQSMRRFIGWLIECEFCNIFA